MLRYTLFLAVALAPATGSANWPSFQNGGRIQVDADSLPLTWNSDKGIVWSVKLTGYGQSSPVVWADTVYVTTCSGDKKDNLFVRALKLSSGETLWEHKLSNSTPEENSNYISRAAPTPATDADGVIAFFEGGNLVALDHDGVVRWKRDLVKDYGPISARHGLGSSLEQDSKYVFVWVEREGKPYVLAISKKNGATNWKADGAGKTAWSSPRLVPVGDDKHLVLSAIGRIVGLEPTTGKLLWEFDEIANNSTTTPMPLGNGRFLIGASEGRGETTVTPVTSNGVVQISQQVDGAYQARFLWRADKATSSFGSPIFAGGNAYFINRAGVVYCLDAENGEQHYAQRSSGSVWATSLHVGDRIYLFGRSGTTTVIRDGKKFEKLAENPLWGEQVPERKPASDGQSTTTGGFGGPVLYGVAVAGNKLLLRRGDRLYCVGANADFER